MSTLSLCTHLHLPDHIHVLGCWGHGFLTDLPAVSGPLPILLQASQWETAQVSHPHPPSCATSLHSFLSLLKGPVLTTGPCGLDPASHLPTPTLLIPPSGCGKVDSGAAPPTGPLHMLLLPPGHSPPPAALQFLPVNSSKPTASEGVAFCGNLSWCVGPSPAVRVLTSCYSCTLFT